MNYLSIAQIKKQTLSSRIPPTRAVAVTSNLYQPHACLPFEHNLFLRKNHFLVRCITTESKPLSTESVAYLPSPSAYLPSQVAYLHS